MYPGLLSASLCALLLAADSYAADVNPALVPGSVERDQAVGLTARRREAMERIGNNALLVLFAAEPRNYSGDIDFPFRQENNFFYLTGLTQPGSTLVLMPGADGLREVLFLPAADLARESWIGQAATAEQIRGSSGIEEIWDAGLFPSFLSALLPRIRSAMGVPSAVEPGSKPAWNSAFQPAIEAVGGKVRELYLILPAQPASAEYRREQEFAARVAATGVGLAIKDASPVFSALRRVKSAAELESIRKAVDITAEAFQRAYALAAPGIWEYEIQAEFEYTFRRRNAGWGYPSIIASGKNAVTLHYDANQDRLASGGLLVMDCGAEFAGYSADVTRTIPVSGRFTPEQAEIYALVWRAQQAGIQAVRPGRTINGVTDSIRSAATQVLKEGLLQLGLITDASSEQQLRIWFNHGIGHDIGLNVHDPGGQEFQPGMVLTVEPGLYFRPNALDRLPKTPENEAFIAAVRPAFEKYKGIGIRIEDDVLVTSGDPKVLSSAIPSRLEDVEAAVARPPR